MSTTYRVNASNIDAAFLEEIKATYGGKEIEIVISEVDETEHLLMSSNNKARLLQAVENVKERQNLVAIELEDL